MCYLPNETVCLWCSRQIDQREASFDLASESEKKERIKRGYYDVQGPQPAVISLNGVIGSLATNEFMFLVTGLRKPVSLRYDATQLSQKSESKGGRLIVSVLYAKRVSALPIE